MKNKSFLLILIFLLISFASFSQTASDFISEANAKFDEQDYKSSIKILSKAIRIFPDNEKLYIKRGDTFYEMDDLETAFYDYSKAIDLNPKRTNTYNKRAIILYQFQMPDEAILDYNKALEYVENDTLKYVIINNRGNSFVMKRDFQAAYDNYIQVLNFNPNDIGALINIGAVLDDLGRNKEAIKYLEKVIDLEPDDIGGYLNLGYKYMMLEEYEDALDYYNKALEIDEHNPLVFSNKAYTYYKLGKIDEALIYINKSLNTYPTNSFAFKNRALIYIAKNKKKLACKDLLRAKELRFSEMYGDEVDILILNHCN